MEHSNGKIEGLPFYRRNGFLWLAAFAVAILAAYIEMSIGATHPEKHSVEIEGIRVRAKLPRLQSGAGDLKVSIPHFPSADAILLWREMGSNADFFRVPMFLHGQFLAGSIPHRAPASKVEYKIEINCGNSSVFIPSGRTVEAAFTGGVPVWLLIPHIILMFLTVLFATRAAVEVLNPDPKMARFVLLTLAVLITGGFAIGIPAEYFAIGKWWSGFPFGNSVTDNKTLVVLILWIAAAVSFGRSGAYNGGMQVFLTILAALATLTLFVLPGDICG